MQHWGWARRLRMKRLRAWRRWAYRNLHTTAWHKSGFSPLNSIVVFLILTAVGAAVLQTEPTIHNGNEWLFRVLEIVFAIVFLIEYLVRLWSAVEHPDLGGGWSARLRYALTWPALIDLVALITLFITLYGTEGAFLRLFRLVQIFLLARLGRYSSAFRAIGHAIKSRRYELLASLVIAMVLLLVSSTLLFLVEGPHQPERFGSIPRAMWWSVATLTTVGYGDVYPVTPLGKILAGLTAVSGIGLIAMPTGIVAAAFSDAVRRQHEHDHEHRPAEPGDHKTDPHP
jgi:voltage-gated potassium channel